MKITRQNELIRYAKEHIDPFNPEDMEEKAVYAHIVEEYMDASEIEDAKILLFMELFTEESIANTLEFLNTQEIIDDSYHPAQYTFTVTGDIDSAEASYCTYIRRISEQNDGWIKGKLCRTAAEGVVGHVSLSFGLVYKEHNNNRLPLELDATFVPEQLSASDSNVSSLKISFSDAASILDNNSDILPEEIDGLNDDEDETVPYKVKVYRVGGGNTITIEKNDKCILFDCGCGQSPDYAVINHIIDHVKPTTIIFSHWHKDHYNLLTALDTSRLKHVIYPNYPLSQQSKPDFQNAVIALAKLHKRGVIITDLSKIAHFDTDFLKKYGYHNIDCFIGTSKPDPGPGSPLGSIWGYSRDLDDSGIIMSIKSWHASFRAILPGDCSYYSWPGVNELDLGYTADLVVPHHGGHAISNTTNTQPFLWYASYYVSSDRTSFTDFSNSNGTTYHRTFIRSTLPSPKEYLTEDPSIKYQSFDI